MNGGDDTLIGGTGEDIVITGWTKNDGDFAVLAGILAAWDTEETADARVDQLSWFVHSRSLLKAVDGKADQRRRRMKGDVNDQR